MAESKTNFGTKVGAILAAAGSAVGLGNVWRFPTETGENGGAAFVLIYILFMLVLGVPVMITELAIGRYGQKSVGHSFRTMSGGSKWWGLMGTFPFVAGIMILSYYAVVAGWTLEYTAEAGMGGLSQMTTQSFNEFSSDPLRPVICLFIILAMTCCIVALGVQKGIERGAKLMMPVLFICLVALAICSIILLPGAEKGVSFLLNPDFSKINGGTILSAMGQAFFSLSVGICCLCTYGCYFNKNDNLMKDSLFVAGIDTLVAITAGLIIFPAVYSLQGVEPDAGPSLVFITLPQVFTQVFAGVPWLGYAFSLLFYLLLTMAALTSSISMLEMAVAYLHENHGVNRKLACGLISLLCLFLGAACSLSFGAWADVKILNIDLTLFNLFDFIVAKLMMPIGALLMCLFVGWRVKKNVLEGELTNGGKLRQPLFKAYYIIVKYLAPIAIVVIFLTEIGLIK